MTINELREECYLGARVPEPWWMNLSFVPAIVVFVVVLIRYS